MPETPRPDQPPTPAPPPKPRRRRWLKILLVSFLSLVVVLLVAVLYSQSRHAFRNIWLPVLKNVVPGRITAENGNISFGGKLRLEGVKYIEENGTELFSAKSAYLDFQPLKTWTSGNLIWIKELEIDSPKIVILTTPETEEEKKAAEKKKEEAGAKPSKKGPLVPFAIEHLKATSLSLQWMDAKKTRVALDKAELSIDNLVPGGSAQAKANLDFVVAPDDPKQVRSGTFALDTGLTQNADGSGVQYTITSLTAMQNGPMKPDQGAQQGVKADLLFDLKSDGSYDQSNTLKTTLAAKASTPSATVGTVNADIDYDPAQNKMHTKIDLAQIVPELLNPILAMFGPAQFESAQFDGSLSIENEGENYAFQSSLKGKKLSIKPEADQEATPLIDFSSTHKGAWNPKEQKATVSETEVKLDQGSRNLGMVTLDKQVAFYVRDADAPASEASQSSTPEEAHINIDIKEIGVKDLRPWLKIADSTALDDVREGKLEGKLTLAVLKSGDRFDLQGELAAADLSINQGKDAEPMGPFTVKTRLAGVLDNATLVNLGPETSIKLIQQGKELGGGNFNGTYDIKKGAAQLKSSLSVPNLADTLNKLKAQKSDQKVIVEGGGVKGELTVARADKDTPLRVAGTADLQNLKLTSEGRKIERSVAVKYDMELNAALDDLTLSNVALNLQEGGGKAAGNITAQGYWPLKYVDAKEAGRRKLRGGQANVKLAGVQAGPWITFLDLVAEKDFGEVPVEHNLTLSIDPTGEVFTGGGEGNIGPVKLTSGDRKIERSIAAKYEIELKAAIDELTFRNVAVNVQEPGGKAAGSITAEGYWPLKFVDAKEAAGGKHRGGQANLKLAGVQAGPWITFFNLIEQKDLGEVPVDHNLTLGVDPTGEIYTGGGEGTIGPVKLVSGDLAPENVVMAVKTALTQKAEGLQQFVLDLTANRANRPPDKIHVDGTAKKGDRTSIQANVVIDSLAAELYTAQFASADQPPATEQPEASTPAKETKPRKTSKAEPKSDSKAAPKPESKPDSKPREWPVDMKTNIQIGQLTWRDIVIEQTKANVSSDSKKLNTVLEGMNINKGKLAGQAQFTYVGSEIKYDWKLDGDGIEAGPIVDSLQPSMAKKVEGKAKFTTQGSAFDLGHKETRNLDGTLTFDLVDGALKNSKLLNFLSEVTRTDFFSHLVYKGFHGEVTFDKDWANLKNVVVQGNATRLIAEGKVGIDGELDLAVTPAIGPDLKAKLPDLWVVGAFANTLINEAYGFTSFPLAVTVKGDMKDPKYFVVPKAPALVGKLGGAAGELLGGVAGGGLKAGEAMGGAVVKGAGTAVKGAGAAVEGAAGAGKKGAEAVGGAVGKGAGAVGDTVKKGIGGVGGLIKKGLGKGGTEEEKK